MTAANEFKSGSRRRAAASLLRRCAANVAAALMMLVRPVRVHPRPAWAPSAQKLAIAAAVAVAVFLIGMIFVDAAAINAVGICRAG